ncbi:MAG: hypothetical protein ACRD3N_02495 [Terracidiphilus sp.]
MSSGTGFNSVTDSFTLSSPATVGGATFSLWDDPGATVTGVSWEITSSPFGGTTLASGTDGSVGPNTLLVSDFSGYDILAETTTIPSLSLPAGTYWFELLNGTASDGGLVAWDESDGPSSAYQDNTGTSIPSETFQISGTTTTVPEGGAPLLYLLLAAAVCGGAIFFGSRTSLRTSDV